MCLCESWNRIVILFPLINEKRFICFECTGPDAVRTEAKERERVKWRKGGRKVLEREMETVLFAKV